MFLIRCKIFYALLFIKTIKRTDGEKRREFDCSFNFSSMCRQVPVVFIETVIRSKDEVVSHKIIDPYTDWYFNPAVGQMFDFMRSIVEISPVIKCGQLSLLISNIRQQ